VIPFTAILQICSSDFKKYSNVLKSELKYSYALNLNFFLV